MSKQKHNAVIVAHPDDETIFFAGLIQSPIKRPWTVVCVTDGNADGQGKIRMQQFAKATALLGVKKNHTLQMADRFEQRLSIDSIKSSLRGLEEFNEVYTHGPIGEYGHPHHQDVALAVHDFYHKKNKVYSIAYNCFAELTFKLSKNNYLKKTKILSEIYFSETKRLIQFLPATQIEGFTLLSLNEVRAIYDYFAFEKELSTQDLKKFKWFKPYFEAHRSHLKKRPF